MTLTMTTLSWAEGESAVGATGPTSGTCGAASNEGGRDSVKWEVTPNGGKVVVEDETGNLIALPAYTLTISGKGDIMDEPGTTNTVDAKGKLKPGAENWNTMDGGMYGSQVTQVIIEEGITGIGAVAFNRNLHKATISIPASVTKIGKRAFGAAMTVTLAEGNTSFKMVDNVLFTSDMKTLVRYFPGEGTADSYTVPSSVETILGGAFQKAKINHIDLGSVKTIGEYAFQQAEIPEIVLPDTVTTFPDEHPYLFLGSTVEKVVVGSGMTTIPKNFFGGANMLKEVLVGKNVESIQFRAFSGLQELRKVTFAEGSKLEKIEGSQTFAGCTKLEIFELPDSCTYVDAYTFQNCSSLRTIVARGIEKQNDFKCSNTAAGDFYKATVSYGAVLRGNYAPSNHGIGMAKYAVNGVQATTLGWYTQEGVKGDKNSINGTSTTVYAVYKADCSFDTNGGTGDVPAIKSYVAPGLDNGAEIANLPQSEVKTPTTTPTRDGYAFMG